MPRLSVRVLSCISNTSFFFSFFYAFSIRVTRCGFVQYLHRPVDCFLVIFYDTKNDQTLIKRKIFAGLEREKKTLCIIKQSVIDLVA